MSDLTPEELAEVERLDAAARAGRTMPLVFAAPRASRPPRHFADLEPDQRADAVVSAGLPAFRADQFARHYFARGEDDPSAWTDVPAAERERIATEFFPPLLTEVRSQSADAGTTVKSLWRLHDGSLVESVLMEYGVPGVPASGSGRRRATLCISSLRCGTAASQWGSALGAASLCARASERGPTGPWHTAVARGARARVPVEVDLGARRRDEASEREAHEAHRPRLTAKSASRRESASVETQPSRLASALEERRASCAKWRSRPLPSTRGQLLEPAKSPRCGALSEPQ